MRQLAILVPRDFVKALRSQLYKCIDAREGGFIAGRFRKVGEKSSLEPSSPSSVESAGWKRIPRNRSGYAQICMGGWMLVLPRPADKHQGVPPNCLPGGGQSPPYGCGRRTLVVTSGLTATDGAQSAPDTVGAVAADDLR